jgi:hypothetical protein
MDEEHSDEYMDDTTITSTWTRNIVTSTWTIGTWNNNNTSTWTRNIVTSTWTIEERSDDTINNYNQRPSQAKRRPTARQKISRCSSIISQKPDQFPNKDILFPKEAH